MRSHVTSQNIYMVIFALQNIKNNGILLTIAYNEVAWTFAMKKLSYISFKNALNVF